MRRASCRVHGFEVGDKVCRVAWDGVVPVIEIGTVTSATKKTYEVDGDRGTWFRRWEDAIDNASHYFLFRWEHNILANKHNQVFTGPQIEGVLSRLHSLRMRLDRRLNGHKE